MPVDRSTRYLASGPAGGPGVALVHGIGVSGRYFGPLTRHLAGTHRVVTPDLPGFGASARPRPALGIAGQADALRAVLADAGLRRPVLLGHSMGSQVVTELAARVPGIARALILVGPVVDPDAASALRQGARLALDATLEPVRLNALVVRDYLRTGLRSYAGSLPHMLDYPLLRRLGEVDVPVILVRGRLDPVAPAAFVRALARSVPGARTVEIPGAGHIAMAHRPDLVAALCREVS